MGVVPGEGEGPKGEMSSSCMGEAQGAEGAGVVTPPAGGSGISSAKWKPLWWKGRGEEKPPVERVPLAEPKPLCPKPPPMSIGDRRAVGRRWVESRGGVVEVEAEEALEEMEVRVERSIDG